MEGVTRRFFSKREKLKLLRLQDYCCAHCKTVVTPQSCEVDHIIPHSKGGRTVLNNAQVLCSHCNNRKSNSLPETMTSNSFKDWPQLLPPDAPPPREWQAKAMDALQRYLGEQNPDSDFTLKADPGFGKSYFAGYAYLGLRCADLADWIVLIAPTTNLVEQYISDFNDIGLKLGEAAYASDRRDLIKNGQCGEVITYAALQSADAQKFYAEQAKRNGGRWLMVMDEVHHLGEVAYISDEQVAEQKAWAKAIDSCLRPHIPYRVSMSGTLFRSDEWSLIPGIRYRLSEDGVRVAWPHYMTDPADGVRNNWTRRMVFFTNNGRVSWLAAKPGEGIAEVAVELSDATESKALRAKGMNYALHPETEYGQTLFGFSYADLCERREERDRAGMLIICRDAAHARGWMDYLEGQGHEPLLVLGEDPLSNTVINNFREGSDEIIVAVKKVSEGCSIKRLEVVLMLTNVTTRMYFNQAAGRANRNITSTYETGACYCPAIPEFMQYALEYEQNFLHEHEQKEGPEGGDDGSGGEDGEDSAPRDLGTLITHVSAEHLGEKVMTASSAIDESLMARAKEYCRMHSIPNCQAPLIAKVLMDTTGPQAGADQPAPARSMTLPEQLEQERTRYNKGCGALAHSLMQEKLSNECETDKGNGGVLIAKIKPAINLVARRAGHPGSAKKDKTSTRDVVSMRKKADWVFSPQAADQVKRHLVLEGII